MNKYPHTIDSGTGEQITFVGLVSKDGVPCMQVENCVKPGGGPPMHVHFLQTESLTVLEGRMGIQIHGEAPSYITAGESATFHPGVYHKFWNASDTDLKCTGHVWPVHNFEYFLTEIYRSTKASGKGRPSSFDAAFLMTRYKTEFDMLDIPPFVKKIIFPLTLAVGKLKGFHRKYKDAPAAVKV